MLNNFKKQNKLLVILLIAILAVIIPLGFIIAARLSTPVPGSTRVIEKDGMAQVYVPAGPFEMGAPEEIMLAECQKYRGDCLRGFYQDIEPPHTVTLDAFWIDRTEVSYAMYASCVKDGRCRQPEETMSLGDSIPYGEPEFANYPMRYVTWNDAQAYCAWAGRRLPTEAEWEKAARGTDGRLYPWGNDQATGKRDNFCDKDCPRSYRDPDMGDGYPNSAPVGSYPDGASPYGALNMAGNLREWTSSLYLPYPYRADDGREDLTRVGDRVVRGGHWDGTADFALSAYRFADRPDYHSSCVGIRCASSR